MTDWRAKVLPRAAAVCADCGKPVPADHACVGRGAMSNLERTVMRSLRRDEVAARARARRGVPQ